MTTIDRIDVNVTIFIIITIVVVNIIIDERTTSVCRVTGPPENQSAGPIPVFIRRRPFSITPNTTVEKEKETCRKRTTVVPWIVSKRVEPRTKLQLQRRRRHPEVRIRRRRRRFINEGRPYRRDLRGDSTTTTTWTRSYPRLSGAGRGVRRRRRRRVARRNRLVGTASPSYFWDSTTTTTTTASEEVFCDVPVDATRVIRRECPPFLP